MFIFFSDNKTQYNKGQIFPFLVAVIVVILILIAITVNLGQIGIYKTDVSNAADAGALAGASVLSGVLLDFGIEGDTVIAKTLGTLVGIIIDIVSIGGIPGAIAAAIGLVADLFTSYWEAMARGAMGWANAKKTALQYAFSNVGVDEPKPTFKTFLKKVYDIDNPGSLSRQELIDKYNIYSKGDDREADTDTRRKIKRFTNPGFSRFMENWEDGFAKGIGKISPMNSMFTYINPTITSGYGWTTQEVNGNIVVTNSYFDGGYYKDYKNWVQVKVVGNVTYPLDGYKPVWDQLVDFLEDGWLAEQVHEHLGWELDPFFEAIEAIATALIFAFFGAAYGFFSMATFGYTMHTEEKYIDNGPIVVSVARHRDGSNLGFWKFKYPDVTAEAAAHAFAEHRNHGQNLEETIKPAIDPVNAIIQWLKTGNEPDWYGNTNLHLFETGLIYAH